MKTLLGLCVYTLTIVIVVLAVGFLWVNHETKSPGPLDIETTLVIEKGMGSRSIARVLEKNDIIENRFFFIFAAMVKREENALKAGEYEFEPRISVHGALYKIANGDVVTRRITIPEGLTSFQIVERLNAVPDLTGTVETIPKEGRLLPQTYNYRNGEARTDVLERMRKGMNDVLKQELANRDPDLPFETAAEVLTMASIVEKETAQPSERARIAGVFINRLRKNIALQTDPTVIYALTQGRPKNDGKGPLGRRLLRKDLQFDSPYNTYLYPGLPPGPIANPGYDAIVATLRPEQHDYLYFVADGTGGHVFSKTLAEHNANVAKWRKIRANQN